MATLEPEPGTVLADRYAVQERLGDGGMGIVYRVHDRELDEVVALKWLRTELTDTPPMLEAFRREVRLARRVTHPNVARTYDLGVHQRSRFITMELVRGRSLRDAVRARATRPGLPEVLRIAEAVARGLVAAHAVGVVHRDLKPSNVLLAPDRVVLTDFGIACTTSERGADFAGTPAFMAPEQLCGGEVDARTDVYAFGLLLWWIITGSVPFPDDVKGRARRVTGPAPPLLAAEPHTPEALARITSQALAPSPSERPDSLALLVAVQRLRGDVVAVHAREPAAPDIAPTSRALVAAFESYVVAGEPGRASAAPTQPDPVARAGAAAQPPPEVRAAYERALAAHDSLLPNEIDEAIAACERALAIAPSEPHVMSVLSSMLLRRGFLAGGALDQTVLSRAEELALAALDRAPSLASTFESLGVLRLMFGEIRVGVRALVAALARDPDAAEANAAVGCIYCEMLEVDRGVRHLDRACAAANRRAIADRAKVAALVGDRAAARAILDDDVAKHGVGAWQVMMRTRLALWWQDEAELARSAEEFARLDETGALAPMGGVVGAITRALANGGAIAPDADLESELERAVVLPRHRTILGQVLAELRAAAGDRERGLRVVEMVSEGAFVDLQWLDACPLVAPMHDDPRFAAARTRTAARAAQALRAFEDLPSV